MDKREVSEIVQMTALNEILTFSTDHRELILNKLRMLYTQFNLSVFLSSTNAQDINEFANDSEVFRDYLHNVTVKILFSLESPVEEELDRLVDDMATSISLHNPNPKISQDNPYIASAYIARFTEKHVAKNILKQNPWLLVLMLISVTLSPEVFDLK